MHTRLSPLLYLGFACSAALAPWAQVSYAACAIAPTAGDDTYTCNSGTAAGFTDSGGNNTLTMSGTGTVTGNASFGAGNDVVTFLDTSTSMRIDGTLDQGDGANIFQMNNGTITDALIQGAGTDIVQISGGSIGAVSQGSGIDKFAMSGGTIASLAQGDGLDDFVMNAGEITGAFLDGDHALMTGGRIGRVDMKLDDNLFDMRGGEIIGNLVTGFGKDTIIVSGSSFIGGNISVSGGDDAVTITGGTVNGQILLSFGNDVFNWTGGNLHSFVLAGAGDDTALLQNLVNTQLAATTLIDGGPGNDKLTLDNTKANDPGLFANWENIQMDNGAQLSLGGTLKLGDSDTGTGTLSLDGTSELLVTTGVIEAFNPGQLVNVNNRGLIDMTGSSNGPHDTLTINGNYTGDGARLKLDTQLGSDGSPSDKLVVSQGTMTGSTSIIVTNAGGAGAETLQDGIQVVQALNGATSSASAFTLDAPVSVGAFEYFLFKGGVTAGTEHNYYLRSTIPVTPLPEPENPPVQLPEPVVGTPPLPPNPGITPIPIYRPEVPVYAALFPAAKQIVQGMLGTYHERMGDQRQQQHTGAFPAGWGRVYGSSSSQGSAGTVNPTLRSSVTGFQVGSDVYAGTLDNGLLQRLGFFVGHSRLRGNVKGFNEGWQDKDAGTTTLRGDSLGVYWTLIGANQAYVDLVLMGTRFNGNNESDRGVKVKTRGHNLAASIEAGWPFKITPNLVLEPQAQLIASKSHLDSQNDGISDVSYDANTNITTRLGVRLRGEYQVRGMPFEPYLRANVWHTSAGQNTVTFNDVTDIDTEQKSTTLGLSVGATLQVATGVSVYSEVGYNRNLDSNTFNGRQGTLGLRMEF
ncbi:autotransporter outer membrane beta-barrel domain-containing protein [Pseudomonas lactucae]|uniref:Autotransporter outer membrane beta-barrel domain-containing protein n=1 Tax=Pseudomonas lactucae TaxID=2813360 RepID=A0A9X0Y9R0_9PSED|nr:autotransporter outer membrane beta-barrel domain-containing protein [Pseudomonas lactucae]MBN2975985.1 autotransporter outer membrane beta-barrel domain-containing protein [Pseudomonas lactucae]MBN2988853.1 autotransporter outer membrane beta-barrel domain-containing protein [Pseudomonas lactucae]